MRIRTCITSYARAHGSSAAQVARKLSLYPPNLSLMDRGRRSVSLALLARIAKVLNCSPRDLIEAEPDPLGSPWERPRVCRWLEERQNRYPEGSDRTWVHQVLLAWQRHQLRLKR